MVSPYCLKILPRHQGLPPQRYHRLVRLADSRCRKRPCSSRTYRCWSGRCWCCWPGYRWSCRFCCCRFCCCRLCGWLPGCRLLHHGLFYCRLCGWLLRYSLFGYWLFGSDFLCCRLLRHCFFGYWLFGSDFLCCRLLRHRLLCCWFSFLLCCHFISPSIMKVKKYNTYDNQRLMSPSSGDLTEWLCKAYCTYTSSPCSAASKG